jgi:hypothetical protein
MTIRELASALKTSVSTAHKLKKAGCPTESAKAAQRWVAERSRQSGAEVSATASLSEMRRKKLELECRLLSIRVERERDDSEMLSSTECLEAVKTFCRFVLISARLRADSASERLAAASTPRAAAKILRELHDSSWVTAALGMANQAGDGRMKRMIAEMIRSEFVTVTEEQLAAWQVIAS